MFSRGSEMFSSIPCVRRIRLQGLEPRFASLGAFLFLFSYFPIFPFSFSFLSFYFPISLPAPGRLRMVAVALVFQARHCLCPRKSLAHQRFRLNFHMTDPAPVRFKVLQSPDFTTPSLPPPGSTAPVPVHPPVDALHSLENAPHTVLNFPLTLKIEGVKTQSFFDTFKVFPVGVASGAQAKSP
jgi:hypothetical protein